MNSHLERYSGPSRFVHWAIAFLILLVLIPVGLIMANLPDGAPKNTLYELHKSFGMTVFGLAVIRVAIRAVEGFPPLPSSLPAMATGGRAGHTSGAFCPDFHRSGTRICRHVNVLFAGQLFLADPDPHRTPRRHGPGRDRARLAQSGGVPDGGYPVPARRRCPLAPNCAPGRRLGAHGERPNLISVAGSPAGPCGR